MTNWIDSHCHVQEHFFDNEQFDSQRFVQQGSDQEVSASGLQSLRSAFEADVTGAVCVGTDQETSLEAVLLARETAQGSFGGELPVIRAVIGLHPHEAEHSRTWMAEMLDEHRDWVAGIGECGLDYFYEHAPKASQKEAFVEQIQLAHDHALPLVIHARDAWSDLFAILDSEGVPTETVLHCFTGGPEDALGCIERGLSVSFSGVVTFKNAEPTREALKEVPLDRLLVETDSPFLAPIPHRGMRNEPSMVTLVGKAVAAVKGLSVEEVARATSATAGRIFGF